MKIFAQFRQISMNPRLLEGFWVPPPRKVMKFEVLKVNPYCLCHASPELLADKEVAPKIEVQIVSDSKKFWMRILLFFRISASGSK